MCARELLKEDYQKVRPVVCLLGLIYAVLPLFPAYWISVASLPWLILIIIKLSRSFDLRYMAALLVYPVFSDMLHFGVPIVLFFLIYAVYRLVRYRKAAIRLFAGEVLLIAGYGLSEYRYIREVASGNIDLLYDVDELKEISLNAFADTLRRLYFDYKYITNANVILNVCPFVFKIFLLFQLEAL